MSNFITCCYCCGSIPFGESEALNFLGITEDQLRIARALDREKVKYIERLLLDSYPHPLEQWPKIWKECCHKAISYLPTFEDTNDQA